MFVWFLYVPLCAAVTGVGQRRTFGPRYMSLQSAHEGKMCTVAARGNDAENSDCCIYIIKTSIDFDQVPRNLTYAHLIFSANHRVEFSRETLPQQLGGPELVRLRMSVRYVPHRRLPPGLFVNLAGLRALQLYHNDPDFDHFSLRLSEGTFESLSEIVDLVLTRLGIEDLPAGVFRGLRSICRLDLSQNRLVVIRSDVFQQSPVSTPSGSTENQCCSNLTELSLSQNRFVDVADIHLNSLTSLQVVDLFGNAIASLDRDSFDGRLNSSSGGFRNIETLDLGYNVIDHIGDKTFVRLVRLRVLFLDRNMISNVTAENAMDTVQTGKLVV